MVELEVYKKDDFYEDYIMSSKEYYERENADAYFAERLAEKDNEIAELKANVNGLKNRTNLWEYNARNEHNAAVAVRMENIELKAKLDKAIAERDGNQVCIDALKAKLEDAKATAYAESVDAGMRERRLKRALYKACANWAKRQHLDYYHQLHLGVHKSLHQGLAIGIDRWKKMETKCRAMAEKFK